jgi:integrase
LSEIGAFASFLRSGRRSKVIGQLGADARGALSPQVLNSNLASVHGFLIWAYETQSSTHSSITRVEFEQIQQKLDCAFRTQKLGVVPTRRRYALTEAEVEQLLAVVDPKSRTNPFNRQTTDRNFLIICLFLETGLRRVFSSS